MTPTLHHQQQQLAALLAAVLSKDDSSKITVGSSPAAAALPSSEENELSRLSAITSLHRTILYPPNALLVSHSASYLAQGLSQHVTDKLRSVRHVAATAYAALCSVLCSLSKASNGRQNPAMLGGLVDGFIAWSLPSLCNINNGTSELALESLNEFLNVGEMGSVERYALPILKVCQELLEDERMPLSLMPRILRVLTLISLKFFRSFQPHFRDIVDLLLGWALVPGSRDSPPVLEISSLGQLQSYTLLRAADRDRCVKVSSFDQLDHKMNSICGAGVQINNAMQSQELATTSQEGGITSHRSPVLALKRPLSGREQIQVQLDASLDTRQLPHFLTKSVGDTSRADIGVRNILDNSQNLVKFGMDAGEPSMNRLTPVSQGGGAIYQRLERGA